MTNIMELNKLRKDFATIFESYKSDMSLKPKLKEIVFKLEDMQKQFDIESGFSEAQQIVHDFLVAIPTENLGKLENREALNIAGNVQALADILQPNNEESMEISLAGISPGSAILMYDFIQKENKGLSPLVTVEETKERITKLLKTAPMLMEKNFSKEKFTKFKKETGIKDDVAYELAKAILKIVPTPSDMNNNINISINNEKERIDLNIDKKDRLNITKAKMNIYNIVKPEDRNELEGKLGIMEEWDVNHKIVIIDVDGNTYTVNYEPTQQNLKRIKDSIGKEVKIGREKDPEDNRRWILTKWIS